MLLLGLFLAGVIHVLISRATIYRWLSDDSLKSVCIGSAVGVPIPLCSCSVVPVVAEMRRKGASRSACISFLITAPETGADSILVTHAFFGLVATVVRPLVSFVTAFVTGVFCIGLMKSDETRGAASGGADEPDDQACADDHNRCHEHGTHTPLLTASGGCYVAPAQLKDMFLKSVRGLARGTVRIFQRVRFPRTGNSPDLPQPDQSVARQTQAVDEAQAGGESPPSLGRVMRHVFHYGFVEVADEILFALVIGICLGGLLFLAVPDGLMASDYARWISYPIMVLVGVPLYICASASTPIAAALVAKGLSPGAALIFLMTGPATNSGTIAIIVSQFGSRFATIYVAGVVAVTTVIGVAIDLALIFLRLTLPVTLAASDSPTVQLVEWAAAAVLICLIVWRFRAGALKSGFQDMVSNLAHLFRRRSEA